MCILVLVFSENSHTCQTTLTSIEEILENVNWNFDGQHIFRGKFF